MMNANFLFNKQTKYKITHKHTHKIDALKMYLCVLSKLAFPTYFFLCNNLMLVYVV